MKRLDMFDFNAAFHPEFDETVRRNARNEIYATVRHVLDKKQPISTLLKADFVMINDVLADFYGISGVQGPQFRKVMLPEDSPRGGLLGTAAINIMGSDGQRSSPVERGVWVLRHLLNRPPPPAPANVPMLSRLEGKSFSARELQKAHQEEAQCAQCHQKIDPIGFAMENFSAAGLWRTEEAIHIPNTRIVKKNKFKPMNFDYVSIEPYGQLPNGDKFNDFFQFRDLVSKQQDEFALALSKALIAYGLGRPFNISDHKFANTMANKAKASNYRFDTFIPVPLEDAGFSWH